MALKLGMDATFSHRHTNPDSDTCATLIKLSLLTYFTKKSKIWWCKRHGSWLRSRALSPFIEWFPHFSWRALYPLIEYLLIWLLCRLRNDHHGLIKIRKRNTWKGSYASYIALNMERSTEFIHCVDLLGNIHSIRQKLLWWVKKGKKKTDLVLATIVVASTNFTNQAPDQMRKTKKSRLTLLLGLKLMFLAVISLPDGLAGKFSSFFIYLQILVLLCPKENFKALQVCENGKWL